MVDITEKSWAQMVQNEHGKRLNLPWKPEQQEPVKYVTKFEMSRKEREFDPLLQRFTEDKRENEARVEESNTRLSKLNKAKVKHFGYGSKYNIVNHSSNIPGDKNTEPRKATRNNCSKAGYNIISNIDLSQHHYASPSERPEPLNEVRRTLSTRQPDHDYNIISNRYTHNDREKKKFDAARMKKIATDKYWKTNNFDPVRCRFFDGEKEKTFIEKLKRKQQLHGKDHLERLPPSLRNSEGVFSDILSKEVKDMKKLKRWEMRHERSKNRPGPGAIEQAQKQRSSQIEQLQDQRIINRCLRKRQSEVQSYEQGFNIINNKSFVGRNGVPKAPFRSPLPKTLWQEFNSCTPQKVKQYMPEPSRIQNNSNNQVDTDQTKSTMQKSLSTNTLKK